MAERDVLIANAVSLAWQRHGPVAQGTIGGAARGNTQLFMLLSSQDTAEYGTTINRGLVGVAAKIRGDERAVNCSLYDTTTLANLLNWSKRVS